MSAISTRAYATFEIKSVDNEQRIIEGIASTPTPDRDGDIMEPAGAQFRLPLPFLYQHDKRQPIGHVIAAQVTKAGIHIRAQIAKGVLPQIDEAWALIKAGLVRGLSIGFRPIDHKPIAGTFGLHIKTWDWFELSAVTVPANVEANISSVKSFDVGRPAASGTVDRIPSNPSGATESGKHRPMNYSEQLTAALADLKVKTERMKALEETETPAEIEERDGLTDEVQHLTSRVARLKTMEAAMAQIAKPVLVTTIKESTDNRTGIPHVTVTPNRPKEMGLVRAVICKMASLSTGASPLEIAKARYPDDLAVQAFWKTAVSGHTTADGTNTGGTELVYAQNLVSEFVEFLRPQTIIGKFGTNGIPSLNTVPFNVRITGQTSGGSGYWVGQALQKPLTRFDFNAVSLTWAKVAAITVQSEDLARFSNPSSENLLRRALSAALIERLDTDFVDPNKAISANVSPASITNVVTPLTVSGTDAAAVLADVNQAFSAMIAANINPTSGVWIMPNTVALALSLMRNALGQPEFPSITMNGGTFFGLPVITSQYAAIGSPVSNLLILVNADDVFLSDDGGISIDASREASLEMSDDPGNEVGAVVSMFQTNQIALRAERFINWQLKRTAAVQYFADVAYAAGSPA